MPSYAYNNPAIGASVGNLAQAIYGDPLDSVRAGMLGDQRRKLQTEREKLEQEAIQQGVVARERLRDEEENAALAQQLAGSNPELAQLMGWLVRGGGNADQRAKALQGGLSTRLGISPEVDDRFQSLVLQGRAPNAGTAVTAGEGDRISGRDAGEARSLAESVAGIQQAGANTRNAANIEGAMARVLEQIAGADKRNRDKIAAGGRSGTPLNITPKSVETMQGDLLAQILQAVNASPEALDEGAVDEGNLTIEPGVLGALMEQLSGAYQGTRNYGAARAQIPDLVDQGVDIDYKDPWFGSPRATVKPKGKAAPSEAQYASLAQLQEAVRGGKIAKDQATRIARANGWIE